MRILIKNHGRSLHFQTSGNAFPRFVYYLFCLCFLFSAGCRFLDLGSNSLHSTIASHEISHKAIYHNNQGIKYLSQGKTGKAETHFLKAINYDPAFAAAHNNLGNMLFSRRDLYQAAWEFQRASELEPNSIEPLINLGLIHDEADRLEEAEEFYRQALQVDPRSAIALGNLVRVRIKQESDPIEIQSMLRDLVLIDNRIDWVEWAQELLATRYRVDYGSNLSNQPPSSLNPQPNLFLNPLPSTLIPQPPSQPELLPSPLTPAPKPSLMDIPNYDNGNPSPPNDPSTPIRFQNPPFELNGQPDRSFSDRNPMNGLRP